eukprot:scaffold6342_cov162-Ochromonas_danica.AAC.1
MRDVVKRWMRSHVSLLLRAFFYVFAEEHKELQSLWQGRSSALEVLSDYADQPALSSFVALALHVGYNSFKRQKKSALIKQNVAAEHAREWWTKLTGLNYLRSALWFVDRKVEGCMKSYHLRSGIFPITETDLQHNNPKKKRKQKNKPKAGRKKAVTAQATTFASAATFASDDE